MAETIDSIANTAPQQKKEEPKKVGNLESVVDETGNLIKTGFTLGLAAAIPFTQAALVPYAARDTAVLAGAQVAGDATTDIRKGKKYTSGDVVKSAAVGTAISVPIYHLFDMVNKIPTTSALGYIAKGAAWGGIAAPLYVPFYQFVDYTIKNKSFKGVCKYIKENFWPTYKTWLKYLFPINLANIFFVPPYLQIPVSALTSYFFALFGAPKKGEVPEEQKRDKTPYLVAATNAVGRGIRNLFYAPYNLAYATGRALSNGYERSPSPVQKAKPKAQPDLQPA